MDKIIKKEVNLEVEGFKSLNLDCLTVLVQFLSLDEFVHILGKLNKYHNKLVLSSKSNFSQYHW